jgi:outer membrane protein
MVFVCVLALCISGVSASAATVRVGVVDMQKVLATSSVGKKAQQELEKKMKGLQAEFKKDEEELFALQKEIEKKGLVWSDEMKREKAVAFQKKRRELIGDQEDGRLELKQLEQQLLGPIMAKMETVLKAEGKKGGYTVILPRNAALYFDDKVDLTDTVAKALDKANK